MIEKSIDRMAIFSDGTAGFVSPCEPDPYDRVTVRCRVGKNQADSVTAVIEDVPYEMKRVEQTKYFDFYAVSFLL